MQYQKHCRYSGPAKTLVAQFIKPIPKKHPEKEIISSRNSRTVLTAASGPG